MRIVRFKYRGEENWGIVQPDSIRLLKSPPFPSIRPSSRNIPFKKVKFLPPAAPSKIILIGLNYRDHAKELNMPIPKEPVIFMKPVSSLIACAEDIIYPPMCARLDYEAELALVIKKKAKNIRRLDADKYILGYTCLNDVTARDLQKRDGQWTRAKSFDTFCPVGPWLETEFDPANARVRAYLNGKLKQDSSTRNFIFDIRFLVCFISKVMTLYPGDLISTGTPAGVGPMRPGDTITIDISGIARLENRVARG
ncbi:MAG: fumarylacetoacetate hydrolase family protein [Candidatus Omnitrophica bacterium]|nr:fumarylacetoacetate hydrolase family protein [Candidatus Omnitrophota bacterium]